MESIIWIISDPSCGWCESGTGTGLGVCRVGGAKGPLVPQKSHNSHFTYGHIEKWVAADTCMDEGKTWHFTSCSGNLNRILKLLLSFPNYSFNIKKFDL